MENTNQPGGTPANTDAISESTATLSATAPKTMDDLKLEEQALKVEELRIKIKELKRPEYSRLNFWTSSAAVVVAIGSIAAQNYVSSIKNERSQLQMEQAIVKRDSAARSILKSESILALSRDSIRQAQLVFDSLQSRVDDAVQTLAQANAYLKKLSDSSSSLAPADASQLKQIASLLNKTASKLNVVPSSGSARETFIARYKTNFGAIPSSTSNALFQIFDFISRDENIKDIRQVAYILATIKYETAGSFLPATETLKGTGKKWGIPDPVTGQVYYGRGYLLLVWKDNYAKMNAVLQLKNTPQDLVLHPDLALNPTIAYRIASYGMLQGSFTGKKLSDYINDTQTDYVNARRVVSGGLDRAEKIAGDARFFESLLKESIALDK